MGGLKIVIRDTKIIPEPPKYVLEHFGKEWSLNFDLDVSLGCANFRYKKLLEDTRGGWWVSGKILYFFF